MPIAPTVIILIDFLVTKIPVLVENPIFSTHIYSTDGDYPW